MKSFTFFNKKYAFLVSLLFTTNGYPSQTVLALFASELHGTNTWIIDATSVNDKFSYKVENSSSNWNDSRRILSSIYLNTSTITQSTEKTSSEDIHRFKDAAYFINIGNYISIVS